MPFIQNVHIPSESKNLAINGNLDFWQEKVGNTSTVNTASTVTAYSADMLAYQSGGATTKNYSVVRHGSVSRRSKHRWTLCCRCEDVMISYKLRNSELIPIEKTENGVISEIPNSPENRDWQEYQAWLAQGNEPEPADPIEPAE